MKMMLYVTQAAKSMMREKGMEALLSRKYIAGRKSMAMMRIFAMVGRRKVLLLWGEVFK